MIRTNRKFRGSPSGHGPSHGRPREIAKVLIPAGRIQKRVRELGKKISADYRGKPLTLVPVLKGSLVFAADLIRAITVPCAVDFISLSSYGRESQSGGVVRLLMDLRESPEGKHLVLVEDIVDSGRTLDFLRRNLLGRGVASVRTCVLLDKKESRIRAVPVAYRGFTVPNRFVVGYGLDFAERFRNLPYIGVLKAEVLEKHAREFP